MLKRRHVSKHKSAAKFRHHVGKTKTVNLRSSPMRGGWRM